MWSEDEEKQLKTLTLSPHVNTPERLRTLVQHFMNSGTVWGVTEGDGPLSVSKVLARKISRLTRSGELAWVLDRSAPPPTAQVQTAENELGPHQRELYYFGIRLRDRLSLPRPDQVVKPSPKPSRDHLGLWTGPGIDESFRDEEEAIETEWGFEDYDARNHSAYYNFRRHLAQARCWELMDQIGETFGSYKSICDQIHEQIRSEIGLLLPDLAPDDLMAMSLSLLANIYRPPAGSDWIEFDYTPVNTDRGWAVELGSRRVGGEAECGQLAAIIAAHRGLVDRTASWDTSQQLDDAQRSALQSIDEFRTSLLPNSRMRKLIVGGRCGGCV